MFRTTIKTRDGREIVVREIRLSDLKELRRHVNEQVMDKTADGIGNTKIVTLKEERKWLNNALENVRKKKEIYLVIERGERIIGDCGLSRGHGRQEHTAHFGILVERNYRRQGIGLQIIPILFALARKRMKGLKVIYLEAFSYNRGAQGLYKKAGFRKVATIPDACMNKGKLYNKIVMIYYLRGGKSGPKNR